MSAGLTPSNLLVSSLRSVLPGNADSIEISAAISQFELSDANNPKGVVEKSTASFIGIFDTGASRSVVSDRVAERLNLAITGKCTVSTANGEAVHKTHAINIVLPNGLAFPALQVTSGPIGSTDFLLGMDIIGQGDFIISRRHEFLVVDFHVYIPVYPSIPGSPVPKAIPPTSV